MLLRLMKPLFLTVTVLCLSFSAAMADAVIKKNHMKFNGLRYYKAAAQQTHLGAWGDKKTPATQANYLDQKGSFKSAIQDVTVTRFRMKQAGSTMANVVGNFSMAASGLGLSGNDFYQKLFAGEYEFLEISIKNKSQGFKTRANRQKNKIDNLKQKDGHRIVTSIIVVVSGAEATRIQGSHQGSFSGTWNGAKLTVDSDVRSRTARSYQPAPGTVYAYMLDKVKWDAQRKKKRTKIVDLNKDQHGPY